MDNILCLRIEDIIRLADKTGRPQFFGFLRPEQRVSAETILKNRANYMFFGGYDTAERVILAVAPKDMRISREAFPIMAVTLSFRASDSLSHRDFLGSVLALGIKRETVGDILIESGRAVIFLHRDIYRHIAAGLDKVGRVGVRLSEGFEHPLPAAEPRMQLRGTVASLRLDGVIAELINKSRGAAAELIENGAVSLNSDIAVKVTRAIASGDIISVRGFGKFKIISTEGLTKKGRTVIDYEKY